jgi:hypothetical protein
VIETVTIHQPNHLPWLGYFAKLARADVFVFLDDAQFPKGSYVNRVQIAGAEPAWLTVPVKVTLGDPISAVVPARADWARAHRERLLQVYRPAAAFRAVWPEIESWLGETPSGNLATANIFLIGRIAARLGLGARFVTSSSLGVPPGTADARLAEIVHRLAPGGRYLSGAGGANYQSDEVFAAKGITLVYSDFRPRPYTRGAYPFVPGLSVLDALFHLGWDATGAMVAPAP